jgi:hypothetical protein
LFFFFLLFCGYDFLSAFSTLEDLADQKTTEQDEEEEQEERSTGLS